MKRSSFTLIEFLIVLAIMGVFAHFITFGSYYIFQIPFYLLFGWLWGLLRIVERLLFDPLGMAIGAIALLALWLSARFLVVRFHPDKARRAVFRKTLLLSILVLVLAAAGASVFLLLLEIREIALSKKSILYIQWSYGVSVRRSQSRNNLFQNSYRFLDAADPKSEHIFYGGTILPSGQPGHGWMTQLLPFNGQQVLYEKIDLDKPWNHPANADCFREKPGDAANSYYFDKLSPLEKYDTNGFRKTDYTANEHLLAVGRPFRLDEIGDGASNTILFGEAKENLAPWGSPMNSRDPALGIDRSPFGFGGLSRKGRYPSGCFVSFCDGGVRFLSSETDQEILRALATPNGGEAIEELP